MLRGRWIPLAAFAALLMGCRTVQEVVKPKEVPLRSAEKVVDLVLARDTAILHYYKAKADVELSGPEGTRSFGAHIRSVLDSAVWISVTPALGIEVARALLTPDSLHFMDKLSDRFWTGDTSAAQQRFGLQPSLPLLQDALLGRPFALDAEEKYKVDREEGHYVLTSKEKRRFRRAAEDMAPDDTLPHDHDMKERRLERTLRRAVIKDAVVVRYWVDPETFLVDRVLITDLAHDQQADVRYLERTDVEGHPLPGRISLSLSDATRNASGSLSIDHVDLEGPLQLPFKVPEKFTRMP